MSVVLVVSPFDRVWHVEVGCVGEGAFLTHGYPKFLATHGIGIWFVVLQHKGSGMVTVKAFDVSFYMNQFHALAAGKYLICKSLALETNSFFSCQ
jgi:hypothetical protein